MAEPSTPQPPYPYWRHILNLHRKSKIWKKWPNPLLLNPLTHSGDTSSTFTENKKSGKMAEPLYLSEPRP
jgi:hypothetical protein